MQEKNFYPRVKSRIFLAGVQEKNFYSRVKSRIFLSGVQETNFYPRIKSRISLFGVQKIKFSTVHTRMKATKFCIAFYSNCVIVATTC